MSSHEASIKRREIAILAADGVNEEHLLITKKALELKGAITKILSPTLGQIKGQSGEKR